MRKKKRTNNKEKMMVIKKLHEIMENTKIIHKDGKIDMKGKG